MVQGSFLGMQFLIAGKLGDLKLDDEPTFAIKWKAGFNR
jgi:hypothetical protein